MKQRGEEERGGENHPNRQKMKTSAARGQRDTQKRRKSHMKRTRGRERVGRKDKKGNHEGKTKRQIQEEKSQKGKRDEWASIC